MSAPWSHLTPEHVGLAKMMYSRWARVYRNLDPEEINLAWMNDVTLRDYWLLEAWACLVYIADLEGN